MIPQIGVLLPNRPGQMKRVTELMAENEINCLCLSTYEGPDFGTVYVIVDQPAKLEELLESNHFSFVTNHIVAVAMENKPGYMNQILTDLGAAHINIGGIYTFYNRESGKPIMLCNAPGLPEIEMFLSGKGYEVVTGIEELL